ncbi:ABC transporter ATP-binding protein [Pseudonocardia halophobica]|uniref:ABC transporter ATP-binding protein n=1 Tax=Pseudonocardia halophobica TaxID=29401 RepID=UPI003D926727
MTNEGFGAAAPLTDRAPVGAADRPAVTVSGVGKHYPTGRGAATVALEQVDLTIGSGEFLSLLGPSGCGKSTLLRLLAGLEEATSGRIGFDLEAGRSPVSVVFQDYSIFPWKTVEQNVAFGLRMTGTDRRTAYDTARSWLRRMDLGGFERSYPGQLSGGMKKRVSLARALAVDPALLLLDEPFAALDAQMRQVLQEDMLRLWEEDRRRTAVIVTHDLDEALLLGDRVVLMSARPGRVRRVFDVPFARPRSAEIRYLPEFAALRREIWAELRAVMSEGRAGQGGAR